ncbi:MAG: isoprenylcysteine carboxylmethyltransferase family protein [Acidobacteria bacterium]|nr:MAG: isoprenylcysteine carboxylmethyltransferase family protein [Acidobacteriota bacterium]
MNDPLILRLMVIATVVAAFAISGWYRRRAERGDDSPAPPASALPVLVLRLLVVFLLLGFFAVWAARPELVAFARLPLPPAARGLGLAAAIGVLPLFVWIFRTLGANVTPTALTRQRHRLITTGPYRWVRHPLYAAGTLFFLALALATASWLPALYAAGGFGATALRRRREEAALEARFGDAYRRYRATTGAYLPRLTRPASGHAGR